MAEWRFLVWRLAVFGLAVFGLATIILLVGFNRLAL
jgi:hypothetical protein